MGFSSENGRRELAAEVTAHAQAWSGAERLLNRVGVAAHRKMSETRAAALGGTYHMQGPKAFI